MKLVWCACMFNSQKICAQFLYSNFLTYIGFHACMFNSRRIWAQGLCHEGSMPAYSIPRGYVHHSDLDKICACIFNSHKICAQGLYSDLLDYFLMKDPLGCWTTYLGVWFSWKCFGNDFDLPWSFDDVWPIDEGVPYWGFSNGILFIGEQTSTREMITFFSFKNHWGLMLIPPSRGFYQTLLGKFCIVTLKGATFVPWTHRGVHLWY